MTYRVLLSAPYMQPEVERFRAELEAQGVELVVPQVRERLEEEELLSLMTDIEGVICGDDRFTERVLAAAPRLRVIAKWGTGVDSIDRAACIRRGVRVVNTPDAFTVPVTESILGYLLAFARRQPWMDRAMKAGAWQKLPGHTLAEAALGIIGVGCIGKRLARVASSFGMRVLGNDLVDMPLEFVEATGIQMVDKLTLYRQADYISINCDLNPTSYHLIGQPELAEMKPIAVIINTARGPIINEQALIAALQSGVIRGAALDVFEQEPLPAASPLRGMTNVLLAPHNANSSPAAWERVHRSTIDQLMAVLQGTPNDHR